MNTDPKTLSLMAIMLLADYLSYRCSMPPNPPPPKPYRTDRIGAIIRKSLFISGGRVFAIASWFHCAALTLTYPHPPALLCPCPQNLSPEHFTWSPLMVVALGIIFVSAPIRLLAYAQLGRNFTFELAKPQRLVTTGLYAYVQHPSYVSNVAIILVNFGMMFGPGGAVGCWLPGAVVDWMSVVLVVWGAILVWGTSLRVRDEEEMLKNEFGPEWELWHRKTKRFLPGVF